MQKYIIQNATSKLKQNFRIIMIPHWFFLSPPPLSLARVEQHSTHGVTRRISPKRSAFAPVSSIHPPFFVRCVSRVFQLKNVGASHTSRFGIDVNVLKRYLFLLVFSVSVRWFRCVWVSGSAVVNFSVNKLCSWFYTDCSVSCRISALGFAF